jgi:HSP20 family molecular chaperone IbpA
LRVREIRNVRNEGVGCSESSRTRNGISKYNRPQITVGRESLAEVNVYDKEVKVVLEMSGVKKEHIRIQAYKIRLRYPVIIHEENIKLLTYLG